MYQHFSNFQNLFFRWGDKTISFTTKDVLITLSVLLATNVVTIVTLVIVITVVCKRHGWRQESLEMLPISADVEEGPKTVIKIDDTKLSEETQTDRKEEGVEVDPIYSEIAKAKWEEISIKLDQWEENSTNWIFLKLKMIFF